MLFHAFAKSNYSDMQRMVESFGRGTNSESNYSDIQSWLSYYEISNSSYYCIRSNKKFLFSPLALCDLQWPLWFCTSLGFLDILSLKILIVRAFVACSLGPFSRSLFCTFTSNWQKVLMLFESVDNEILNASILCELILTCFMAAGFLLSIWAC